MFEGGAQRPTVPWRPFRAFPDGYQGSAHRAFLNGPHGGKQEHKTHNRICLTFPSFPRLLAGFVMLQIGISDSETMGRCQIVHCTALRSQNGEDEEETQRKQEEQGNWDEEATEKRWEKPNKTQERG